MADYWVFQVEQEEPKLAWVEPTTSVPGSGNSLWTLDPAGGDSGYPTTFQSVPEAIADHIRRRFDPQYTPNLTIKKYPLQTGQYHPRINRNKRNPFNAETKKAMLSGRSVAKLLYKMLEEVFTAVEPDPNTAKVSYGHRMRQFLILACTEIEAGWAGILSANGYPAGRWSTNDYIKLLKPMRLNEWSVRLSSYPDYPEIIPFEGWDPAKLGTAGYSPTESLKWYDAYNKVKHNREVNLSLATLAQVIAAAAAMHVLGIAQFGQHAELDGIFKIMTIPTWTPEQFYFSRVRPNSDAWTAVNCTI